MPRHISFSMTTPQFLDGSKDVTRRMGWKNAKVDEQVYAARKCMGLKPGEKIERIGLVYWISVRFEPLRAVIDDPEYGRDECRREGFPKMTPAEFVEFFCAGHKGCTPERIITRLEFGRLPWTQAA